jgi:hypothetical protein
VGRRADAAEQQLAICLLAFFFGWVCSLRCAVGWEWLPGGPLLYAATASRGAVSRAPENGV